MPTNRHTVLPYLTENNIRRFMDKIGPETATGCREWTGARIKSTNRGVANIRGTVCLSSRLAYLIYNGVDPAESNVLHTCDNPPCIRKEHLFLGNQSENGIDCAKKGRTGNRKATQEQVLEMRRRHSEGASTVQLARDFGMSQANSWDIVTRNTWSWL